MVDILDLQSRKVDGLISRLETDYYKFLKSKPGYLDSLREEVELIENSPGITDKQKKTLAKLFLKIDNTIKNLKG